MPPRASEAGFSLVEILVVLVIIGILAAIGIPRYIEQQRVARDAVVFSDLRNLVVVVSGIEAEAGLTDDPEVIADDGWRGTDDDVRVCAELNADGDDLLLAAWHVDGNLQYSWQKSNPVIQSNDVVLEETCAAQLGGTPETVWPQP